MADRKILRGSFFVDDNYVNLNLVDCSAQDAQNIEGILEGIVTKSLKVNPKSREEDDQYLMEYCKGPGWSNSVASIYGDRKNPHEPFLTLKVKASFSGARQFWEKIQEKYELFSTPPQNYRF